MQISRTSATTSILFLTAALVGLAYPTQASAKGEITIQASSACEDFAQRQVQLADRLLNQSNYSRALKVLNSTAENCNIEMVREKIVEALGQWYGTVRGQGPGAIRNFLEILSAQSHISTAQKEQFKRRIAGQIRGLIEREYDDENYRSAYRLCRSYREYSSDNFAAQYYCGRSAEEVEAEGSAMQSYRWLVQNWNAGQSLATWKEVADRLEALYFQNGRFRPAYELARQRARRDPSPRIILSSLVSARGHFLAPVLAAGSAFYENDPTEAAFSVVENELKKVNFPKYVKAVYILQSDGRLQKGLYGSEANEPSLSLLETTSQSVSLLQSKENSSLAWLVSRFSDQYLVLEFGIATTPEENVRLETVYENVESDEEWAKLYNLEFTETSPATGSAVSTFLSGVRVGNEDFDPYEDIFDDSSLLTYFCIQDQTGTVVSSHNFDRANLAYGDSEWERSSNTPALYHHLVEYSGEPIREVVWPRFVDDSWTGVVRVGLTNS